MSSATVVWQVARVVRRWAFRVVQPRSRNCGFGRIGKTGFAAAVVGINVMLLVGCDSSGDQEPVRRAVMVDQLSLTVPNETFVTSAMKIFGDANYQVRYVPGEEASVELFRTLPASCADIIVLRVHSARLSTEEGSADDVALFTGELIDPLRYDLIDIPDGAATAVAGAIERGGRVGSTPSRQLSSAELVHLVPAVHSVDGIELPLFGITPDYVRLHLDGDFDPAPIVILMGCDGLRSDSMARAFVDRGARSYISWDEPVQAGQTDLATLRLIHGMLTEGLDPNEAVEETMAALGPDRLTGARMVHFP